MPQRKGDIWMGTASFIRQARKGHPLRGPQKPWLAPSPRSVPQRPFHFCPGEYFARLVDELRPLTYGQVGNKLKLMPKDEWTTILGHSPEVADALIQSMILTP